LASYNNLSTPAPFFKEVRQNLYQSHIGKRKPRREERKVVIMPILAEGLHV
jgi:hypothetical protein